MQILAGKWTTGGWVVCLDGSGTELLQVGQVMVVPFVARPEEYWASMRVIKAGYFPECWLEGKHDGVRVAGLIGEEVVRKPSPPAPLSGGAENWQLQGVCPNHGGLPVQG